MSADFKDLDTDPPRRDFLKYPGFSAAAVSTASVIKSNDNKAIVIGAGIKGLSKEELAARLRVPVADLIIVDSMDKDLHTIIEEDQDRGIEILKADLGKTDPYVIQKLPEPKNLIPVKEKKNYITGKKLPKKKRRK